MTLTSVLLAPLRIAVIVFMEWPYTVLCWVYPKAEGMRDPYSYLYQFGMWAYRKWRA